MTKTLCKVEGCDRPIEARGLCNMHYQRWWNHGTTDRKRRGIGEKQECKVIGCDMTTKGGFGYCGVHYRRFKRYGDPGVESNHRVDGTGSIIMDILCIQQLPTERRMSTVW